MGKGGKADKRKLEEELKESKKARKAKDKAKDKGDSKKRKDKAKGKQKPKGKAKEEAVLEEEVAAESVEPEQVSQAPEEAGASEPEEPEPEPEPEPAANGEEAEPETAADADEPEPEPEPEPDGVPAQPEPAADDGPLVTREEIVALPRIYKIGKRPLSKLLGWGELTYTRLIDGRTPNKQHAEQLRRLIDEPAAYAQLLERGRESGVITAVAYQKSRDAVDALLGDTAQDGEKLHAVATRFCVLAEGDLTPRALQVLMYYAHGWSLKILGAPLFDFQPTAGASGPEYAQISTGYGYDAIQQAFQHAAEHDSRANRQVLTDEEISLVEAVYAHYGQFSGSALARMASEEPPYRKARKRMAEEPEDVSAGVITAKSLEKHFADAPCPIQ